MIIITKLNDEYKRFYKFLTGDDLQDKDIKPDFNIEEEEKIYTLIKNLNDILEKYYTLGREILKNLPKNPSINDFLLKVGEIGLKKAKEDPEMVETLQDSTNIVTNMIYSLEFQKTLFSIPIGDPLEQLLKSIFIQELEAAEKIDRNKIAESFKLIISYVVNKPKPDQLFLMSKFQELQLPNLETDNIFMAYKIIWHNCNES